MPHTVGLKNVKLKVNICVFFKFIIKEKLGKLTEIYFNIIKSENELKCIWVFHQTNVRHTSHF